MTDEAKLAQVREFLASLSSGELKRMVEFFRMQMGLLTGGIELRLPGNAVAAKGGR